MTTLSERLGHLRYRVFYGLLLRRGFDLVTLCAPGSICPWTISPRALNSGSVVYSGGVGSDISFEHELVKKFGCEVVLLDRSPAGWETMSLPENKIPQFRYFPLALAGRAGKITMAPPLDPAGDSWFACKDGSGKMEVSCTDLQTLMAQNGHRHIDLLKLDIEASEYEVIEDILRRRIPVHQICVEYHHGLVPGVRLSQMIRSMLKLIARGYKLLHQAGTNHTFLLAGWPPPALS